MQEELALRPDRRMGLIFHLVLIGLIAITGLVGSWLASQASIGPAFMLFLLLPIAAIVIMPMLVYRVYGLQTAGYTLERNGVHLSWGLRVEDIPIDQILWMHPANELSSPLPLPWLQLPGILAGKRHILGNGVVEFMASSKKKLLFIATTQGGFVISPADPNAFLQAYQRFTEMGSLAPLPARSVFPSILFGQVWASRSARIVLLAGGALSLALLGWVVLSIPGRSAIHLGFHPDQSPGDLVPSNRLLLLPFMNFGFLFIGFLLGLFFFRRRESQPASFLLWSTNILASILFLIAVFFILQNS
jgi:hypothetical protein